MSNTIEIVHKFGNPKLYSSIEMSTIFNLMSECFITGNVGFLLFGDNYSASQKSWFIRDFYIPEQKYSVNEPKWDKESIWEYFQLENDKKESGILNDFIGIGIIFSSYSKDNECEKILLNTYHSLSQYVGNKNGILLSIKEKEKNHKAYGIIGDLMFKYIPLESKTSLDPAYEIQIKNRIKSLTSWDSNSTYTTNSSTTTTALKVVPKDTNLSQYGFKELFGGTK